jgi:hypothetical protein
LRELFEKMDWAESYEAIASFVEPLDQMDSDSFAFRYPVNKKDNDALPKAFMLNVLAFARDADSCLEILYNASYSIDDRAESAIAVLSDSAGDPGRNRPAASHRLGAQHPTGNFWLPGLGTLSLVNSDSAVPIPFR